MLCRGLGKPYCADVTAGRLGGKVEACPRENGDRFRGMFIKAAHALIGVRRFCFWGVNYLYC